MNDSSHSSFIIDRFPCQAVLASPGAKDVQAEFKASVEERIRVHTAAYEMVISDERGSETEDRSSGKCISSLGISVIVGPSVKRIDDDHVIDPVRIGPDSWEGNAGSRMIEIRTPNPWDDFRRQRRCICQVRRLSICSREMPPFSIRMKTHRQSIAAVHIPAKNRYIVIALDMAVVISD
jgi:hypothetical protein